MLTSGKIGDGSQHFWGCVWVLLTCVVDSASVSGAFVDVVRSGCRMEGHAMPTVPSVKRCTKMPGGLFYTMTGSEQRELALTASAACLHFVGPDDPRAVGNCRPRIG